MATRKQKLLPGLPPVDGWDRSVAAPVRAPEHAGEAGTRHGAVHPTFFSCGLPAVPRQPPTPRRGVQIVWTRGTFLPLSSARTHATTGTAAGRPPGSLETTAARKAPFP